MVQKSCKTLGFKKIMVYKIPPGVGGGRGKPYLATGLYQVFSVIPSKSLYNYYPRLALW